MAATQQQKIDIRTRREIITPEQAQALLALNTHNRALATKRVNELATAIKNGHWRFNGASIVILANGQLGDGQHRLAAVVVAGMPIETNVTYGVTQEAFPTIDIGRVRTTRDLVALSGIPNANIATAAASVLWRIIVGAPYNETVSPELAMAVLDRYQTVSYWSSKYHGSTALRSIIPGAALVAACVYLDQIANRPDLAHDFYEKMSTGLNIVEGDPVGSLRNKLLTSKIKIKGAGLGTRTAWPFVVRTINMLEAGEKSGKRFNTVGALATTAPTRPDKLDKHLLGMTDDLRFVDFPPNASGGLILKASVEKMGPTRVPEFANRSKRLSRINHSTSE